MLVSHGRPTAGGPQRAAPKSSSRGRASVRWARQRSGPGADEMVAERSPRALPVEPHRERAQVRQFLIGGDMEVRIGKQAIHQRRHGISVSTAARTIHGRHRNSPPPRSAPAHRRCAATRALRQTRKRRTNRITESGETPAGSNTGSARSSNRSRQHEEHARGVVYEEDDPVIRATGAQK